jgi:hypothetical protein
MKSLLVKRTVLAGIAAVTITAAGLGVAGVQLTSAATPTPTATGAHGPGDRQAMQDKLMAAVAAKLNINVDKLTQAFGDARKDLGLPDHAAGGGQGHPGGERGGPGGEQGGPGGFLKPAADKLGLTGEQLWQELQGKSLTDVANAHKVDPKDVAKALKDAAYARIDQEKTDGKILTDAQVSDAKKWAADRIDILMTRVMTPHQKPGGFDQRGPREQIGGFEPRGFRQQADGFQFQQHGPRF